jgi:tRNA threonylcarbamoyladenosine biosynthesis protein TsaB
MTGGLLRFQEYRYRGPPVNILALDTATSILSAALNTEAGTWFFEADAGLRHSELLMGLIETLMNTSGLRREQVEAVVCMKGPGSFTGLRIGFSAAKGLALSLGIPFASVPTLDCMAAAASAWPGFVLPLIDAKQSCFFAALYRGGQRLSNVIDAGFPRILDMVCSAVSGASPDEQQVLLTGPGAELFYAGLNKQSFPEDDAPFLPEGLFCLDPARRKGWAKEMLEIVKNVDIFNNVPDDIFSGPDYIRKSDAELHLHSQGCPQNSADFGVLCSSWST